MMGLVCVWCADVVDLSKWRRNGETCGYLFLLVGLISKSVIGIVFR